jgi:DNA-directed RNA polymerase specialized sigma24 family protein
MTYIEEYNELVQTLAAEYARRYTMVERDDIGQELWVWFVGHPRKYKEWSALPRKDKDKLIAKSLRNKAITYCEREKARTVGYELLDLYYYDASVIEAFLPSIIAESYEIPTKIKDLNFKFNKSEAANDGNNWLVLRSDIAAAYYKLSEAKQFILKVRFTVDNVEWSDTAKELDTTPDGARMKVQRTIASLIRNLGGWKPQPDDDLVEADDEQRGE